MKILKLEFKNLNSLKGEWIIDFTNPAYANDGLFAIVGPTGAGKSTILDAICLSLYGKTPRLNNSITISSNEIMNRASADCYAQTTFSCYSGEFRTRFDQRFSRNNRDANLQAPKMEIENLNTGEKWSGSKSYVSDIVTGKTGLTYEQFTRAVLLAQGQFKLFLDSNANDRSELLETITGTQIYSDISILIYKRSNDENRKLKELQDAMSNIEILTDEQQKDLEDKLKDSNSQTQKLKADIDKLNLQLQWVKGVKELKKESESILQDIVLNEKKLKEFEPQREQLVQDKKASVLLDDYNSVERNRSALERLDNQIKTDAETIKKLEEEIASANTALSKATAALNTAKEEIAVKQPIIEKVKALDTIIAEKKNDIEPEQEKLSQLQSKFIQECRIAKIIPDDLSQDLTTDSIESLISKKLCRVSIPETRKIINKFNNLKRLLERLLDVKKDIAENESSVEKHQNNLVLYNQSLEDINKEKQLLISLKNTTDQLQETLQEKINQDALIIEYDKQREKLADGSPCPLCGSESHPYCKNQPAIALTDNKKKLEDAKKQNRELDEKLKNAEKNLTRVETQIAQAEKDVNDLKEKNSDLKKQSNAICDEIGCDYDVSVKEIENRIRLIAEKTLKTQNNLEDAEKQDALKTPVLVRDALNQQKADLKQKEDDLSKLLHNRRELFGSDDPDKTFQRLSKAVDDAAKLLNNHKEKKTGLEAELTATKQNHSARQEERKNASKQYDDSVTEFKIKLEKAQFVSTDVFLKALLTENQREEFQQRQKELDEQKTRLDERQKTNKEKLTKLEELKLANKSEEELNALNVSLRTAYDELHRQIGVITEKLSSNEQRKKQFSEKQAQLVRQQAIAAQWSNLSAIIGSEDGKKYRKIVQRMSLEILIDYANEQMAILSPRYQLTLEQSAVDESESEEKTKKTKSSAVKEELKIYCIDSWQGGAVRPTNNLSGGESFLVSLALALGLSKMSSQNRALETLFLDEGFGSLDEETLQTALDAINKFQYSDDSNKLVGVISHVDALKERIANKIEVSRSSAGASVLSGPGVTKIS